MGRQPKDNTGTITVMIRNLPVEIHTWLRVEAVKSRTTIAEVLTKLIRERIEKGE